MDLVKCKIWSLNPYIDGKFYLIEGIKERNKVNNFLKFEVETFMSKSIEEIENSKEIDCISSMSNELKKSIRDRVDEVIRKKAYMKDCTD
jgi:hypothetical protein